MSNPVTNNFFNILRNSLAIVGSVSLAMFVGQAKIVPSEGIYEVGRPVYAAFILVLSGIIIILASLENPEEETTVSNFIDDLDDWDDI